jgi:transcriptional regulator with XRE-family HTH domain
MKVKGKQPHRRLALAPAPPEWLDPLAVRQRLRMNRTQFATCFGISASTLRQWESGRRRPRGAALILMHVIWRQPRPVLQAIAQACRLEIDRRTLMRDDDEDGEDVT